MKNKDKKKYPVGIRQKMEVREPAVEYAASKRIAGPQEPVDRNAPLTRGEFRDTMLRVDDRLVQIDERFDRMDARLDKMDARFDKMDGRLDKMDDKTDARFDKMNDEMDARFDKVDGKLDKINDRLDKMNKKFGKVGIQIEEAQKRTAWSMVGAVIALGGVYAGFVVGVLHYLK